VGVDVGVAGVWGLVRSAQSENPGRLVLVDVDPGGVDGGLLVAAVASGEPEVAVRGGRVLARRLARVRAGDLLAPPAGGGGWRLDVSEPGTLDNLVLAGSDAAVVALAAGQVRVGVRAAGVNFKDVLIALGMYPGGGVIGSEVAGIVTELGPGVGGLAVGDAVMGIVAGGAGPVVVADARMLVGIPDGWSFAAAASVPVAFATAYYALVDLADVQAGETVLVHAAAGGVGMAAVQIARHLGARVLGTASAGKWQTLRGLGLSAEEIASSRDLGFAGKFLAATGGDGADVVLDSLAREFVDASLGLLPRGGRFIEMGKTDVRDPGQVAADHPGVAYQAFDLVEAGPQRIGDILAALVDLFDRGVLAPSPVRCWDVRRAGTAFRFMREARHTGKLVLTIPRCPDPHGTTVITGGTGTLGGWLARHLAETGQARHLLLASRSGPAAAGVAALAAGVAGAGAGVTVAACDAAVRQQAATLIASVPADAPLTAVIHTAGALDDATIASLTPDRLSTVWQPKAAAAWHLHELTQNLDLATFVLFSSAAATFGNAGQGNYAAANAFLDALAEHRRAAGLAGQSLAWGLWAEASGMTGHLDTSQRSRLNRGGLRPLTTEQGLALFDAATSRDEGVLVPVPLDTAALRAQAGAGALPAVFAGLVHSPVRRALAGTTATSASLSQRLAGLPGPDQDRIVLDVVRSEAAAVLGHTTAEAVPPTQAFRDLGFDSLTAVELRNRLGTATGLRLPATLVFDYPTPAVLASWLRAECGDPNPASRDVLGELDRLRAGLLEVASDDSERLEITSRLEALLREWRGAESPDDDQDELDTATDDEMFDLIDKEIGL
jgi:mycoketide-CoA synthase